MSDPGGRQQGNEPQTQGSSQALRRLGTWPTSIVSFDKGEARSRQLLGPALLW